MAFRIVVGGIHIESSTFTPYISGERDFVIRRGEALMARYPWYEKYKAKAELIPLIHAGAVPGGVVDRNFFDAWLTEFLGLLQKEFEKGGLDGVLFDIHGAMSVQNLPDAEGYIAKKIREIVGEGVIVSTSMDLHGNVTDLIFDSSDLITCYRTAPHIDVHETRERAFFHLLKALENKGKTVYKAKVSVPILLPGEKTSTEVSPGKEIYEKIPLLCDGEAVLDASIWMGFPWADEERCHGVVAAVGFDEERVREASKKLAEAFFEAREEFLFIGPTAELKASIREALDSSEVPFFISDTGDNPGAGGAGDMNLVLKGFVDVLKERETEKKILFASIFDRESLEAIYRHVRDGKQEKALSICLGGKIDPSFGGGISLEVQVLHLFEDGMAGRGALVKTGNLFIIVTENRFQYGSLLSFQKAGVKAFEEFDIIVVKMGYLEPDLSLAAAGWVMALTPGAVSQDILNLPYKRLQRPLYPFDELSGDMDAHLKVRTGRKNL